MARNQEKAQAMLNRFIQAKRDAVTAVDQKRPFLASDVEDVNECERWRASIIREVSKAISGIQNGSLGEHKIRDLNDQINKLLREKKHWERQIKILGGRDYVATAPKTVSDSDGRNAMGTEGYYYFGAARELPGVRELFEKTGGGENKRNRYELHQLVDADYYGYGDDDDGKLVAAESVAEKRYRDEVEEEWLANTRNTKEARYKALNMEVPDDDDIVINRGDGEEDLFKAHVPLPSTAAIEKLVVEKRRRELLAKFANMK